MCGIVAYKGRHNCLPFLLNGLHKLEYRGYDSAGLTILNSDGLQTIKSVGKVSELEHLVSPNLTGSSGVAHTRWATHGKPSFENCHPLVLWDDSLSLVHNGIIENYKSIKDNLKYKDKIKGDTDSEVLLYLIYEKYEQSQNLLLSVRESCSLVDGAFAIVILGENGQMICARKGSPMVIGYDKDGLYLGSDSLAISEYCDKIIYVPDSSICDLTNGIDKFMNFHDWSELSYKIEDVGTEEGCADKEGFDHFMMKEIYEQPSCIDMCLRGRISEGKIKLGGFLGYENVFANANHITIVACGSSYHAGILGKYFIEELCGIKTSVEHASEFRYRNNNSIKNRDIVIGISQSGETADTISALEEAKNKGAIIVGVTNIVNSSIARLTDCGIHIRAGREIGVASTKAFTNQVISILLLSLWIEQNLPYKNNNRIDVINQLLNLPSDMSTFLNKDHDNIKNIAEYISSKNNCLYLGRGVCYPIALEGALKLKEISYIHAEGYAAGEMKHGPIALIDSDSVVVALLNNQSQSSKMISNIQEIKSRGANVISVGANNDNGSCYHIDMKSSIDILSPILSVIPLQLLAYYVALSKGCDVDKPRNLAKSVTVE